MYTGDLTPYVYRKNRSVMYIGEINITPVYRGKTHDTPIQGNRAVTRLYMDKLDHHPIQEKDTSPPYTGEINITTV